MKKLYEKAKTKLIGFIKWLWRECKDWHTLALLAVVCAVLGLPVWLGYLLGFIFGWEWAFVVATAMWAFWMLPGAPFFALSVSITLAIKRVYEKRQRKKRKTISDTASSGKSRDKEDDKRK